MVIMLMLGGGGGVLVLAKQQQTIFNTKSFWPGVLISLLSLDILGFSTYRENIIRAIKSRLICLSTSRQKKLHHQPEKRPNVKKVAFRFGRFQSTPPIMWISFYKFYLLGIYKCTNNEFEFLKLPNILQIEKKNRPLGQSQIKVISRKGAKKNQLICKIKLPQKSVTWKRINEGYFLFHLFLFLIFLLAKQFPKHILSEFLERLYRAT